MTYKEMADQLTGIKITPEFLKTRPLSYSSLKAFKRSPLHYLHYLTSTKEKTPALIFGGVVDVLILTPDQFELKYVVAPEIKRTTKEGKIQWDELVKLAGGKEIISQEMFQSACNIRDAVMENKKSREIIDQVGTVQRKINWDSDDLPHVMFSDMDSTEGNFICDLKSAASAEPEEFQRSAFNFGYHIQAALYLEAFRKKMFRFPRFIFMVVEKEPPYSVAVFDKISESFFKLGMQEIDTLRTQFKYCMENDLFMKSYDINTVDGGLILDLPGYARQKIQD